MKDCCDNCKTGDPCCTTNEAKTSSIDGKALYDFLQKRFKMSKSKAIATMKQHKMDMSFLKNEFVKEGGPGSGKPKDGSSKDKEEMERKAKEQAKKDMEDEFDLDFDESVNEVDRRAKSQIFREWNKFEKEYGNFFKAVVKLGKVNTKVTGDKTDEKIFLTDFTRNVGKFYSLMQSWVRGQNESVDESDLPITTKKGKTITAVHKKSGKEIVVVDTPASRKKLKRMGFEVNEGFSSSLVKKAVDIAKKMSGNMTGAVKKIEKIKKGLSKDKQVMNALRASNESVNESEMTHVLTKDIGKKKMKDLEQYLWHVLDLAPNKDFRLSSNGKILSVNVDKINSKSVQNIKKRYGVDLNESINEATPKEKGNLKVMKPKFKKTMDKIYKDVASIYQNLGSVEADKLKKAYIAAINRGLNPHTNMFMKHNAQKILDTAFKNESVNEAVEPQGNMAKIAKVVKDKQYTKLSGVLIDGQSANLLMKLFNAVSDKDKEKMNKMNARLLTTIIKKLWSRVNLKLPI